MDEEIRNRTNVNKKTVETEPEPIPVQHHYPLRNQQPQRGGRRFEGVEGEHRLKKRFMDTKKQTMAFMREHKRLLLALIVLLGFTVLFWSRVYHVPDRFSFSSSSNQSPTQRARDRLAEKASQAKQAAGDYLESVMERAGELGEGARESGQDVRDTLAQKAERARQLMTDFYEGAKEGTFHRAQDTREAFAERTAAAMEALRDRAEAARQAAAESAREARIAKGEGSMFETIGSKVKDASEAIKSGAAKAKEKLSL